MVDTVRTEAELLSFLHPNVPNAMPDATVMQAQTARDLIVTLFGLTAFYTVESYGLVGDDATDNTAAFNAMMAAVPQGSAIVFPPGIYRVGTLAPVTKSVRLIGHVSGGSIIKSTVLTGEVFDLTANNVVVEHLGFTATANRTGGSYVRMGTGNGSITVMHCEFARYFIAVNISCAANGKVMDCFGNSSASGAISLIITDGNVHTIMNCVFNTAAIVGTSMGLYIAFGVGINTITVYGLFIGHAFYGLFVQAPAGQTYSVIRVTNSDFDTCTNPCVLQTIGSSLIVQVLLTNSWFGNSGHPDVTGGLAGITVTDDGGGLGSVQNLMVLNCLCTGNATSGFRSTISKVYGLIINGGHFQGANTSAIIIPANMDHFIIKQAFASTTVSGYGVSIAAGTAASYTVSDNCFAFATTGTVQNGPGVGTVTNNTN